MTCPRWVGRRSRYVGLPWLSPACGERMYYTHSAEMNDSRSQALPGNVLLARLRLARQSLACTGFPGSACEPKALRNQGNAPTVKELLAYCVTDRHNRQVNS